MKTFEVTRCDRCGAVSEVEVEDGTLTVSGEADLCPKCAAGPDPDKVRTAIAFVVGFACGSGLTAAASILLAVLP